MAWKDHLVPMLQSRFPGISPDQLRIAHSYAYGGSVIQDIGYYPFGSHYFSDLLHYVRPEDFVTALIRDSTTPDEYAFALGALAHYCGDTIGHPAVNQVTADENPKLGDRYGRIVTYADNPPPTSAPSSDSMSSRWRRATTRSRTTAISLASRSRSL